MGHAVFGGFDNIGLRRGLLLAVAELGGLRGGEYAGVGAGGRQGAACAVFLAGHAGGTTKSVSEYAAQGGAGIGRQYQVVVQGKTETVAGDGELGGKIEGVGGVHVSDGFFDDRGSNPFGGRVTVWFIRHAGS